MPIAFPPQERGADWDWASQLAQAEITVDTTNIGNPGEPFDTAALDPGTVLRRAVNLRLMGSDYEDVTLAQRPNQADPALPDGNAFTLRFADSGVNRAIAGVTRDSAGVAVGNCNLDLYITGADILAYNGTSDAAGNFSFSNPGSGPFYIVAYKVGAPDLAGTTVNTLTPTLLP